MKWSPQQDAALGSVHDWLTRSDEQVFRLFGYAGTGKTTLARHFAEGVEGLTLFGAFTGKAAYVLRQKGCDGATTIHAHIYHPKGKSQARLRELECAVAELRMDLRDLEGQVGESKELTRLEALLDAERKNLARPAFSLNLDSAVPGAKLVIIDECSMVDGRIGQDLLSFGTKVLVLGDPAQLPPIGDGGFFTAHDPDIMLTEIHRQAKENPIIQLATDARQHCISALGEYGSSRVIERADLPEGAAQAAGQILVGKNVTRHAFNRRMRQLLGQDQVSIPTKGDKLVCLRNNHDLGLLNGSLWNVNDAGIVDENLLHLIVEPLDGIGELPLALLAHLQPFEGKDMLMPWWERKEAEEFDYGYAMTVHKSQGSQWDDVLLFDESRVFRADKWRWLYTGITRAAERITIVRM